VSRWTSAAAGGRTLRIRLGIDNVFIERLWRSRKHEDIYLKSYADGREARAGIGEWIVFYNEPRRSRVDHKPTGTEADTALGGMIEKDNRQTEFQLTRRQKWSRCAGPLQNAPPVQL
jgi:hypothetical protein